MNKLLTLFSVKKLENVELTERIESYTNYFPNFNAPSLVQDYNQY